MKRNAKKVDAKVDGIRILENALALCDANLRGSQGSERLRIQGEIDGIRARLRELGA